VPTSTFSNLSIASGAQSILAAEGNAPVNTTQIQTSELIPRSSSSSSLLLNSLSASNCGEVDYILFPQLTEHRPVQAFHRESFLLSCDTPTEIVVCAGSSARFHIPNVHFEFTYDAIRTMNNSTFPIDKAIVLYVEWLYTDSIHSKSNEIPNMDLEAPSLEKHEVPCDSIFGD
jgi:hypothetical protein